MRVIQITKEFAEANQHYQIGACKFGYNTTTDGKYICSLNSELEFADLFKNTDFPIINISNEDLVISNIDPIEADPNIDIPVHLVDFGNDIKCGIVNVPKWNIAQMIIDCNIYFGNDTSKTKRIQLSVDNDVLIDGIGAYDLFKYQLVNNTPLYPLTEQLLLMRKDYILTQKL